MIHARIRRAIIRPEIIIPVFFLSIFQSMAGQSFYPGTRSLALGGICAISTSPTQSHQNPALLGHARRPSFSTGHARPFVIKELGIFSLETVITAHPGAFQFRVHTYGLHGYRIVSSELGFGMALSEKLTAGISFNYGNTFTSDQWNYLWSLSPGAGIHYTISPRTSVALLLNSPFYLGNFHGYGPLLPSALSAAISHEIYQHTTLLAEATYSNADLLLVKTGLEYRLNRSVVLLSGYHSKPHSLSFGSALEIGTLQIDLAFRWSAIPGITPAITLSYIPRQ
ncbi:MAG: hypothetical protein WD577_01250 [Bacteroidales bacterium]